MQPSSNKITIIQEDPYKRIQAIQKKLNYLCCEHDSYMPILDFHTFCTSLHRWQTSLKKIVRKINDYETQVHNALKNDYKQRTLAGTPKNQQQYILMQKNVIESKNKINELQHIIDRNFSHKKKAKVSTSKIGASSQSKNTSVLSKNNLSFPVTPDNSLKHSPADPKAISSSSFSQVPTNIVNFKQKLEQISRQKLDELEKYTELTLALFTNQFQIIQLAQSRFNKSQNPEDRAIIQQCVNEYLTNSHTNLLYQKIHAIRASLPNIDFRDFLSKTIERLKTELIEINEDIELEINHQNLKNTAQIYMNLQKVQKSIKNFEWQLAGLRKKSFLELQKLYQKEENKYEVNKLQKKIVKDLKQFEEGVDIVKKKLKFLKK